eukprot:TRINITY_DN61371_c0_g1_i1.p1 TRINITY_DN61371_c0_g1~~TRINITY_DN61371_c0_g1_i1.p1  ORF type:complete len:705 (+),score=127.38 TRINITY_DN61371_c0_g1_i1:95-2209(+)
MSTAAVRYDVTHVGGEVFTSMDEHSDRFNLWGELLREKERNFYRQEMKEVVACFSIKDTYQINVRCLWQPHAKTNVGKTRPGPHITLLHGYDAPLTSSWTWIKLGRPLYKKGFSVILMDMPGFGRSKMNMDPAVKLDTWVNSDWHVVGQTLDELRVMGTYFIGLGRTCGTLLKLMMRSPHTGLKEQIWFDPYMDIDEVLGDEVGPPPAGAGRNWRAIMRQKQRDALEKILKRARARVWSLHNKDLASPATLDMQALLVESVNHPVLKRRTCVQEYSNMDMCRCHIGANIEHQFLYLHKELIEEICKFFDTRETATSVSLTMPKYASKDPRIRSDVEWYLSDAEQSQVKEHNRRARGIGADPAHSPKNTKEAGAPHLYDEEEERQMLEEQANPLKAIMAKSIARVRPQTSALEHGGQVTSDVYGTRAATAGTPAVPRSLTQARMRMGPSGFESVKWVNYSQAKHPVRDIKSREQCSIFSCMREANFLSGSGHEAQKSRTHLLSKLTSRQRDYVWGTQTQPPEDEGINLGVNEEEQQDDSFKGFGANRMAKVMQRARGPRMETSAQALSDADAGTAASRSHTPTDSRNASRTGSNAGSGPSRATTLSATPAVADTSDDGMMVGHPGSMRSTSNLPAVMDAPNQRKGSNLAESGSIRTLHRAETAAGLQTKPARSKSNLSSDVARSKRSTSHLSVKVQDQPEEYPAD